MSTTAIAKMAIMNELSRIPEANLEAVKNFIDSLLVSVQAPQPTRQNLKGIWKDTGFDKISDLTGELRTIRHELQDSILQREI